jgi:glutathione S-transferase
MALLVSLSYSPWSEKARWALDYHRIRYRNVEYLPMIGEGLLRAGTRRWIGKVTVPAYFDRGSHFLDSLDIAKHADALGKRPTLFPKEKLKDITLWNDRSEVLMASGRALLLGRMQGDQAGKLESLPPLIPEPAKPLALPLADMAIRFLKKKHAVETVTEESNIETMQSVLQAARAVLNDNQAPFLLGTFSFADIALGCALQFVEPVEQRFIRLGPATRAVWRHSLFAREFKDLLAWRDQLFALHRRA